MSEQNQESIYLKLMQEMGAKPYEGFNPIGARSHRWMMDVKYPPKFRAFGWVLWRTIDRDRDGRTGPPKKKRTAFAHDERAGKGGHLEAKHMHEDLGMTLANAIDELTQLAKEERIRIDEKGRIWLRADSPEPIRIQGEDTGHGNDRVGPIFLCI